MNGNTHFVRSEYYNINETMALLSRSRPTIFSYCERGFMEKVQAGGKSFIPKAQVHRMYALLVEKDMSPAPTADDILGIRISIDELQQQVKILRGALGIRGAYKSKTTTELRLMRQEIFALLSRSHWNGPMMEKMADYLTGVTEQDFARYADLFGSEAWNAAFDLVQKMIDQVNGDPVSHSNGFDIMRDRLLLGRERCWAMLYMSTKIETKVPAGTAKVVLRDLYLEANGVDQFIAGFIAGKDLPPLEIRK